MVCVWNFQCLLFICLVIKAKIFKRKHAANQSNGPGFVNKVKILKTFKGFIFFKLAATSKEIKIDLLFLNHLFKKVKKIFCWYYLTKIMFYFLMVFSNKLNATNVLIIFIFEGSWLSAKMQFFKIYTHPPPYVMQTLTSEKHTL